MILDRSAIGIEWNTRVPLTQTHVNFPKKDISPKNIVYSESWAYEIYHIAVIVDHKR